ncbi:MAG: hypothetical protein KDA85_15890 [Planctomycetaceae bacterium]|nr:hypothetical protein [Planctomycetaceae bacterium]
MIHDSTLNSTAESDTMSSMLNLDQITEQLLEQQSRPLNQRLRTLKRLCPWLIPQLEADRGKNGPFPFWGRSLNVDEITGTIVVEPAVTQLLCQIVGIRHNPQLPNAGLQHTYGYLFSVIDTPFGRKRERWTETLLETSLQLPVSTFSPEPATGTLLANATWLAGSIAFHGDRRLSRLQQCLHRRVSQELCEKIWPWKCTWRLRETVCFTNSHQHLRQVEFRTDLCPLDQAPSSDDTNESDVSRFLLVYSICDSQDTVPRLVTLFPVDQRFFDSLHSRGKQRRATDIRPRYNAAVPGFPAEPQTGECQWIRTEWRSGTAVRSSN